MKPDNLLEKEVNINRPKVSIGIPVFNGENFIVDAIESVLKQTYSNLEIVISDNASTDKTQEICEKYKNADSRIHYYRNDTNLGAGKNFNIAFELSTGKYFIWLAHDDYLHKDFLSSCVSVLEKNPDFVLCSTGSVIINKDGEEIDIFNILLRTNSPKPHLRFRDILMEWHNCFDIFGLILTQKANFYKGNNYQPSWKRWPFFIPTNN